MLSVLPAAHVAAAQAARATRTRDRTLWTHACSRVYSASHYESRLAVVRMGSALSMSPRTRYREGWDR